MLHDFSLAGRRVRLWQRPGESYQHVLLKALGYAMFVGEYPDLQIELSVGLRYKPDLVALSDERRAGRRFAFWGECGTVSVRKVNWLLKHGDLDRLVIFKLDAAAAPFLKELRASIDGRYRQEGRVSLINFAGDVAARTIDKLIESVPRNLYAEIAI